jgi:hypothetical protein
MRGATPMLVCPSQKRVFSWGRRRQALSPVGGPQPPRHRSRGPLPLGPVLVFGHPNGDQGMRGAGFLPMGQGVFLNSPMT